MHDDSDIQLMMRFKKGESHAFQTLFNRHKKRVINYCFRFCGNQELAEDLSQETFLRVYKAAPRYKPKARFTTWLFKIATNVCLNELRKPVYRNRIESLSSEGGNESDTIPDQHQQGLDADVEFNETLYILKQAIMELPEKQRAALLLKIEGEFSYKEIAKQIDRTENNVKILIFRARQRLKEILAAK